MHAGEVEGLAVDVLGRREEALRARVLQDVPPVLGALNLWDIRYSKDKQRAAHRRKIINSRNLFSPPGTIWP